MRLIDAEEKGLLMELFTYRRYTGIDEAPIETAIDAIQQAPTIDAVQVVRCKDCEHYESDGGSMMICNVTDTVCDNDDYCSYGERREDSEE